MFLQIKVDFGAKQVREPIYSYVFSEGFSLCVHVALFEGHQV